MSARTGTHINRNRPFVVAITSGKGGVGKTLTTVNLAIAARKMGLSVMIFDGDLGLANVDVVLGLSPRYNIRDVLDGHAKLADIIIDGPMGMKVIPSGSGVTSLTQLSFVQRQNLLEQIEGLDLEIDILLIDTGAGISDNVLHFNTAADRTVIVTTSEPHSMTDAYAMIKVLSEDYQRTKIDLVVNQVRSQDEGRRVAEKLSAVAERFLSVSPTYLGCIPHDPQVQKWVRERRAAGDQSAHSIAGQAWAQLAQKIFAEAHLAHGDSAQTWENVLIPARARLSVVSSSVR